MAERSLVSPKIVTGVFSDSKHAADAITMLLNAGFDKKKLSVIGTEGDELRKIIDPILKSCPDHLLIICALFGAIIGAFCGWYSIAVMPGAQLFLSSMPLMACLSGSAAGAYIGLFVGGILNSDPPPAPTTVRNVTFPKRDILVSVSVLGNLPRYNAESILKESGAEEVLVAQMQDEQSATT